jgi:glycosyltransferase involved in cell wall biosynthesis
VVEVAKKKIRIAHLVSHPVQYLVPVYRELSKSPDIDFTVYFFSDTSLGKHFDAEFGREFAWSTELLGGYNYKFLPSSKGKSTGQRFEWPNWDILSDVRHGHYDVIWINSYMGTNAFLARLGALFSGTPVFFRDDTNLLTPRPFWKRAFKNLFLRPFLRGTWAFYVGEENKRYWNFYGVPPKRLFFSPHCVDNDYWSSKARELAPRRAQIRQSLGITDDRPVILFCAKFIPKKQPLKLLQAFEIVRRRVNCWLLMVGDGYLKESVEREIRERNVQDVVLAGFLNQDELPLAYMAGDVFVLPSAFHETWGLVVNEAMNFSLPIVASDQVGCGRDLVKDGWNGFTFPHDDTNALAERLIRILEDEPLRKTMGANSASLVTQYTVQNCATGVVRAGCAAGAVAN